MELKVCQKNVANALNSVVTRPILKNKVQFVTFPFFFMVELQNFLNAPRKLYTAVARVCHCAPAYAVWASAFFFLTHFRPSAVTVVHITPTQRRPYISTNVHNCTWTLSALKALYKFKAYLLTYFKIKLFTHWRDTPWGGLPIIYQEEDPNS